MAVNERFMIYWSGLLINLETVTLRYVIPVERNGKYFFLNRKILTVYDGFSA